MSKQPIIQTQQQASSTKQGDVLDGFTQTILNSLQVGAGAGACGMLFGATAAIIRSAPTPVLFSLVSGFQWFGLSSVFYGTRKLAIARLGPDHKVTPAQKVTASATAGAVCVVPVGLLVRGPRSILPGAFVFSLLGAGGQFAANKWSASDASEKKSGWLDAKWSPFRRIPDEEYENMLEEQLLRLEADIAIVDENLTALRAQKEAEKVAQKEAQKAAEATVSSRDGRS
ncbi:hypothetical protein VM1G_00642 [Cytospora mali]|uniref:Uncharacterized protein n=1 Tax=Cytospora mali TaxID=578113 RepID=A0A194VLK8_CYTMA|nr:hypothetical protein VM1G_00642 [Valsa mali]